MAGHYIHEYISTTQHTRHSGATAGTYNITPSPCYDMDSRQNGRYVGVYYMISRVCSYASGQMFATPGDTTIHSNYNVRLYDVLTEYSSYSASKTSMVAFIYQKKKKKSLLIAFYFYK